MFGASSMTASPIVIFLMKYQFLMVGHGLLTVLGMKQALFAFGAQKIIGN